MTLSAQQTKICQLAAQGMSIKQIANELNVSGSTIRNQRARIMRKLSANNFSQVLMIFEYDLSVKSTTKKPLNLSLPDITIWYNDTNGRIFTRQIYRK